VAVDPDRVGMIGFSAGAMLTLATTLHGDDAKPAFIGLIYGPLSAVTPPADAPPMFIALAADDPFFANARLWPDRQLARGQAARRVPPVRARRPRVRHVSEDHHQHGLVRRLRPLARHARHAEAQSLTS
jgi:dienelactone hydrolase